MRNKIWDLKPDGGAPRLLTMSTDRDATEAIERDPERYSREAPEGTPEHAVGQKRREHAAELAEVAASENKALADINAKEAADLKAIEEKKAEAKREAEEKARAEHLKAHPELAHQAEADKVKADARAARAKVKAEHDKHRAELAKDHAA